MKGVLMTIQVDAVYCDGVLRPVTPLALPNGAAVHLAVETKSGEAIAQAAINDPLAAVIGIGEGPDSGDVAARHNDYLYGAQP
jgi:predicted DNA-binding antitoxin AbrB/MazE fold protein